MGLSGSLFFDDRGNISRRQSRELRDRLDALQLGGGFADYVVRNLGFIAVDAGNGVVAVRMRPSQVAPRALSALIYWLADRPADRVVLTSTEIDAASHVLLGPAPKAGTRLSAIVTQAQLRRSRDLLSKRCEMHGLEREDPLRRLVDAAGGIRIALRKRDFAALAETVAPSAGGCYAVSVAGEDPIHARVEHVGAGYEMRIGYWLGRVIGHRMRDLPATQYGGWTADAYAAALRTGAPVIDEVDATVTWPGQSPQRHRYRRLIVPWRGDGGPSRILSAVVGDARIDLRGEGG